MSKKKPAKKEGRGMFGTMFATWKHTSATIVSIIAFGTSVGGVVMKVDNRYAHAGEVKAGFNALESGQLRQERRYIMDQIGQLETKQSRLTDFERQRLRELQQDLKDINARMKELKK